MKNQKGTFQPLDSNPLPTGTSSSIDANANDSTDSVQGDMDQDVQDAISVISNYLKNNGNPHTRIVVDSSSAEIVEGRHMFRTSV